jgi:plastocyanin
MPRFVITLRSHGGLVWLALTLALATTLVLASCGGGSTTAPAPTATLPPTATSAPSPTATTAAKTVQIKIIEQNGQYQFSPQTITVQKGTKVEWVNMSDAPHTVTSNNNAFTASSDLMEGQSFSLVFTTAGTYQYHCSIHTYMQATIVVTA